jgi:hypothetical protein
MNRFDILILKIYFLKIKKYIILIHFRIKITLLVLVGNFIRINFCFFNGIKICCTSNMNIKIHKNPFRPSWKFAVIKVLLYTQYEHVIIASFSARLQVLRVLGCEDQNINNQGWRFRIEFRLFHPRRVSNEAGFFFPSWKRGGSDFSRNLPICTENI